MPRAKKVAAPVAVLEVAPPSDSLVLTPEEIAAIRAARTQVAAAPAASPAPAGEDLVAAFIKAIQSTQPFTKKSIMNRKRNTPWTPKDGSPKITSFKRPMLHHGLEISPLRVHNEVCLMLDKVKPGRYCGGYVTVRKYKDGSLNIDYPIRTNSQRLKLKNAYGIGSFKELIQRLLDERADPKKYKPQDEDDD